jgi:uncharacterized lipoprotein
MSHRISHLAAALAILTLAGCTCVANVASSVHTGLYRLTHPFSSAYCPGGTPVSRDAAPYTLPEVQEGNGSVSFAPTTPPAPMR